jgi:hypothetical protein
MDLLPDRFLSREKWEAKLRRNGCNPLGGKPKLATAEWWLGPGNTPFIVPVEGDGRCEFWAIDRLVKTFCWNADETLH